MKKLILCFSLLFAAAFAFAQNADHIPIAIGTAQSATDKLVQQYNLDVNQTAEMLKVQERKYRNLAEIEPLKTSDPLLFAKKIRAMQYANDHSFRKMMNEEQEKILVQKQIELRSKKANLYKELKTAKASQPEIEAKMLALDIEALQ